MREPGTDDTEATAGNTAAAGAAIAPIDPQHVRDAATNVARKMKMLANPDRLMVLCQLSQGECCVGDLDEKLAIGQPTLSQQLAVLRNEAVVAVRRDGRRMMYSIADAQLLELLGKLYELYCSQPTA